VQDDLPYRMEQRSDVGPVILHVCGHTHKPLQGGQFPYVL
jgi:hypothetical protein